MQVSTWANYDSDESLQVTELSFDQGLSTGEGDRDLYHAIDANAGGIEEQSLSDVYLTELSSSPGKQRKSS